MSQRPERSGPGWNAWTGWSTILANNDCGPGFTLWLTGLHGTGKSTLAQSVKEALMTRGYKAEIIDGYSFSHWVQRELHIEEELQGDHSDTPGYDAFITYLCALLGRNGIITITSSVSPHRAAREYAREQLPHFIEVYLHCPTEQRCARLRRQKRTASIDEQLYQIPTTPELSLDTSHEAPECSTLRIIAYLEQRGYIAPLWDTIDLAVEEEEITIIKARLRTLGYLD